MNKAGLFLAACLLVPALACGGTDYVPLHASGAATGSVTSVVTNEGVLNGEIFQIDCQITGLIASPTGTVVVALVTNDNRLVSRTLATFPALTSQDTICPVLPASNSLATAWSRPILLVSDKITATLSSASRTGITAKVRIWFKTE